MALWFKKKIEKDETASSPRVDETRTATVPTASQKPAVPPPVPSRSTEKPPVSFKIPQAPAQTTQNVQNTQNAQMRDSVAPPKVATQPIGTEKTNAVAPVEPPKPIADPPALAPAKLTNPEPPPAIREPVPVVEVKPVMKPVEIKEKEPKPTICVADKSAVGPEKAEPIAADRPALPRSDPKVLYYQLMNGLYDVVFVLDDNGNVIDCNSRAEEIFGYSSDDVWNVPIDRLVYGMNNRMFNLLRKNLGNKRHILIDARCFRSNGTSFLAEVGVSTVQLTRSVNVVFAIRNVDRRKDSAEEIRKMRAALDVLPFPAFTCNLHGEFEVLNPPVLKALGMVDEMEAQKKHFSEMLPDMVECFQAAIRGEDVVESKPMTRPDGSTYTVELRLKPMRRGQEITGIAGSMVMH